MTRRFTGWHMTAIIVAFFGVVVAVNVGMATLASRTFGGTVVDNSYVASQKFNTWLAQGRAQRALRWSVTVAIDPTRHVRVTGRIPAGAIVTALASHPLGRVADVPLAFDAVAVSYVSRTALPAGRFLVRIKVRAGAQVADFDDEVAA